VSLFVLSPEIKDLDEVEIEPGRSTKRPTLNDIPGAPKMLKKLIFFSVEDMDLFVTLNVATYKNILCIPLVCKKYFIFCCIHGYKKEKSKPCCHTLFEVKPT
jgi:hypothetical protein